jgi:N-acetylmuramoyl-L-alanine amidase
MPTERKRTDFIVIHCSATNVNMDIGENDIRIWHKAKGWEDIGYNVVIKRDGTVEIGRPLDYRGGHVQGYNDVALGVCLVGGVDLSNKKAENNFTTAQWASLVVTLKFLRKIWPKAQIVGHRDLILPGAPAKECPSFDVKQWLNTLLAGGI